MIQIPKWCREVLRWCDAIQQDEKDIQQQNRGLEASFGDDIRCPFFIGLIHELVIKVQIFSRVMHATAIFHQTLLSGLGSLDFRVELGRDSGCARPVQSKRAAAVALSHVMFAAELSAVADIIRRMFPCISIRMFAGVVFPNGALQGCE